MVDNSNLHRAKMKKNDEFYTRQEDIEKEVLHYLPYLKNKVIYCNCDDPSFSKFWEYFHNNFKQLKLKKLTSTHYDPNGSYVLTYDGKTDHKTDLTGDGSFASEECLDLLDQADLVITNPPFSKYRDFIDVLVEHHKQFLIIGNLQSVTYKNVFPLLMTHQLRIGYNGVHKFVQPDQNIKHLNNVVWFTNLPVTKEDTLEVTQQYDPEVNPVYDNYAAFEVGKVKGIPTNKVIKVWLNNDRLVDFKKVYGTDLKVLDQNDQQFYAEINKPIWGVPITCAIKVNLYQDNKFDLIGILNYGSDYQYDFAKPVLGGKEKFKRLLIRPNQV